MVGIFLISFGLAVSASGATITPGTSETAGVVSAVSNAATAGYATELDFG